MNCKSSNAYVSPLGGIRRRRYLGTKVPTKRTRKQEGNTKKCICLLFISSSIPDVSVWAKGSCICTCTKRTKNKETAYHHHQYISPHIPKPTTNKSHLQYFLSLSLSNSLMKIMQKKRPRDLHFAQGPFFFVHTHRVRCRKSGSRDVAGTCTCYVLGKLRVRSVGLGETGDRM